jgi:hypothetical protein
MKLKILAIGIMLMMVGSTFVATAKLKDIGCTEKTAAYDSIINIKASSSYEYGLEAGKLLKKEYRLIDNILARFTKKIDVSQENIENQIKYMGQNYPFFLEELRGLSASTNIKLDRLIFLQNKLYSLFDGECTVTLATGKATKNNETFLTFNIDSSVDGIRDILFSTIIHRIFSLKCWIVRINTMEYRYAFWGIPILYELPFLNEKGLGWGSPGTLFTKNESRHIDEGPGIATMLLDELAMMTCKNVSEVASLYKNFERASPSQKDTGWFHMYDGSTSCFCDSEGGILAIEQTHSYIITVFGNSTDITGAPEGILWHTNHHQWLDPNLTGSIYPNENPSSGFRAERAHELLEQYYGNITLDVCKKITTDHGGGYNKNGKDSGDICRHPDKYASKVTAFSWIIMPKELTVYWTHTSPCKGIFWKHDFSKIFDV